MTTPGTHGDIERLLQDYNDAFLAIDGAKIVRVYHFPCLTLRGNGELLHLATAEDGKAFFEKVAASYHDEGNRASIFSIVDIVPIGGRSLLVTVDWKMRRDDGSTIRRWRQSYNLVRGVDGWRIVLSTFHVE